MEEERIEGAPVEESVEMNMETPAAEEAPAAEAEAGAAVEEGGEGEDTAAKRMHWYVVHTYSGYENKVKANLEKAIENRHLEDQIVEIRIPRT